jgi:hypothetical protein
VQAHMRDQLGWFPRKPLVSYCLSPGRPGPSYPMTFGWTFFEPYR